MALFGCGFSCATDCFLPEMSFHPELQVEVFFKKILKILLREMPHLKLCSGAG